jgi:hypothetical protein
MAPMLALSATGTEAGGNADREHLRADQDQCAAGPASRPAMARRASGRARPPKALIASTTSRAPTRAACSRPCSAEQPATPPSTQCFCAEMHSVGEPAEPARHPPLPPLRRAEPAWHDQANTACGSQRIQDGSCVGDRACRLAAQSGGRTSGRSRVLAAPVPPA